MMDPGSVQSGAVVLHQHGDIDNVDPHLGVFPHGHHLLPQSVQMGGYMHSAHSLSPMPSPPVHIVPNPVSQVSLSGSPYVHPGLMQEQTEKYGPLLFHKDDQGLYTCFFTGCGKKLKANFSRHVAKHEMDGDKMDPTLATQIQTSSASKNLGTTKICSHPTHQEWWGTSAEQPVTEFYKRCSKCKKCYIRLQQESKRQRSLEGLNNPMPSPVMLPNSMLGADMLHMAHVHSIQMIEHHIKRDSDVDDEQGPAKRMRVEDSPATMAAFQALTDRHFKEMAELTARHSANSRKLIAQNTAIRIAAELRHAKEKEDLEVKLRGEWEQFRANCLTEREDLYQQQLITLQRELNGAAVPSRACRLCSKRLYSCFLYQCNLCNEEACIRCQAVMVCGVCGTKSCENCTIKHNWLIWCGRCHKTFCSNHRSISDEICPSCEQKVDMMMHTHQLPHPHNLHPHDLDHHQPHLHHHQDHLDMHHQEPHMQMHHHHHHSNHHSQELMSPLKFEELDHDDHHPHSHHHPHHSHSHHDHHLHMDPHMHHDHLQHEHMSHHMSHDMPHHDHMQHHHHVQHDNDHHHYQDSYGDHLQHISHHHDLSDHHQQYHQNYQDQQDYHNHPHHHQDDQSPQYQEQNYQHEREQEEQENYPGELAEQGQQAEHADADSEQSPTEPASESQQYIQEEQQQEQTEEQNEEEQGQTEEQAQDGLIQDQSAPPDESKFDDIEPPPQQPVQ